MANQLAGQINPYAPTEAIEKAFLEREDMLSVYTPVLGLYSIGSQVDTMSYEWATADEVSYAAEVGTGWRTDGTTTTALPVTAASAAILTNYAVLLVEDEIVIVKSVSRTANTIDVYARWEGSTVGAAHVATTPIAISGYNLPLWVKDIEEVRTELETYINYVAKFTVPALNYTKEDIMIKRKYYGEDWMENYISQQMLERDKDLIRTMDKMLYISSATAGTGSWSTGTPALTKWLLEEATERWNIVTSFGNRSSESLQDALTASRNKFWESNVILVSTKGYDEIQKLSVTETQLPQPLNRLSITLWDKVNALVTKVWVLTPIWSPDVADDTAIILNTSNLSIHPLIGFTTPGWDKTTAQENARNDQAFVYDTISQVGTFYKNTNRDVTLITGITYA